MKRKLTFEITVSQDMRQGSCIADGPAGNTAPKKEVQIVVIDIDGNYASEYDEA